jgi:hypothetical protein
LGRVSGTAQTPEVDSQLVRPKRQGANGYRYYARRDRLRRLEQGYRPAGHPIRRMIVRFLPSKDGMVGHD